MKTRKVAVAGLLLVGLVLTGCSVKQVDKEVTGAQLVPGTGNLYRFCDGTTLIYYSDWQNDPDQYEFVIYDGCSKGPDANPRVAGE